MGKDVTAMAPPPAVAGRPRAPPFFPKRANQHRRLRPHDASAPNAILPRLVRSPLATTRPQESEKNSLFCFHSEGAPCGPASEAIEKESLSLSFLLRYRKPAPIDLGNNFKDTNSNLETRNEPLHADELIKRINSCCISYITRPFYSPLSAPHFQEKSADLNIQNIP